MHTGSSCLYKCQLGTCAESSMQNLVFLRASALVVAIALSSCASLPERKQLSPTFYGTWMNVVAEYQNWWEIGPSGVKNFGTALGGGRCTVNEAIVLDESHIDVSFGNSGVVFMYTDDQGRLIFERNGRRGAHRRIEPSEICRRGDGTHFPGAPYPDRFNGPKQLGQPASAADA
jgi:hypothetical protein